MGWGEPMSGEQAIASVCHRQLDPLSLVQLQEVLTYRWQSAHPQPSQPSRCQLPGYPHHRLHATNTASSSSLPGLPVLESPTGPRGSRMDRTNRIGPARNLELPGMAKTSKGGSPAALPAALRAAASIPDFAKSSRGLERLR